MLVQDAVAQSLVDNGATDAFGVLGDGNVYIVHSFVHKLHGRFYAMTHESAAVAAAMGYARATGGLGVATVTHGPGLTNTITALIEATRERCPLLVVAGDTGATDKSNLQRLPQREMVIPTGAGFEQVRAAHTVSEDVAVAVHRAMEERRPVVLNVPADLLWQDAAYKPLKGPRWHPPTPFSPDADSLDDVLGIIASCRRPVVLAGRGATHPRSREAILAFARLIGAPVATTLRARDLFQDDPFNLGIFGTLSHEVALSTIASADCIIAFGASLNRWTTVKRSLLKDKAVVQVDRDSSALHLHQAATAAVHGDAGAVAALMTQLLTDAGVGHKNYASADLANDLANRRADAFFKDTSTEFSIDHRSAILRIDTAFPEDRNLVFDAGRFVVECYRLFHVAHPDGYHHPLNFGSMGLAMGTAVGAAVGSGKPTLMVTGDGGFMMGGLAEFSTAVRYNLDLVAVVFNDGAYGAEYVQLLGHDMDPKLSTFTWPELAPLADSLGGRGYTARTLAELDKVLAQLPTRDRPILIDVKLDPERVVAEGL